MGGGIMGMMVSIPSPLMLTSRIDYIAVRHKWLDLLSSMKNGYLSLGITQQVALTKLGQGEIDVGVWN